MRNSLKQNGTLGAMFFATTIPFNHYANTQF